MRERASERARERAREPARENAPARKNARERERGGACERHADVFDDAAVQFRDPPGSSANSSSEVGGPRLPMQEDTM